MTVGERLKARRLELGITTLDEASKKIGITRQYLGFLEVGKRKDISFKIMIQIAEAYDLKLDQITLWYKEQMA